MAREIEKKRYIDRKEHGILHKKILVLLLSKGGIFFLSTPTCSTVCIYSPFLLFHSKEKAYTCEHLPPDMTELAYSHLLLYFSYS